MDENEAAVKRNSQIVVGFLKEQLFLLCIEIVDLGMEIQALSYIFLYTRGSSINDEYSVYRSTYISVLALALITGVFTTLRNLSLFLENVKVLRQGISVDKISKRSMEISRASSWDSEDNMKSDVKLTLEEKVFKNKNRLHYYKTILTLAFLEDLPLLIVLLYLVYAIEIFDRRNVLCNRYLYIWLLTPFLHITIELRHSKQENEDILCRNPGGVILQLLICAFGFAYKLSYVRELRREWKAEIDNVLEMRRCSVNFASVLDDFSDVSEEEIMQVISLRELVKKNTVHCLEGVVSDVKLLRLLRGNKFNIFDAATCLIKWTRYRKENDCDKIREEILKKDFKLDENPGLQSTYTSFRIFEWSFDEKKNALVGYCHTDLETVRDDLKQRSTQDILNMCRYDAEAIDLIIEHLSLKHKAVVKPVYFLYQNFSLADMGKLKKLTVVEECVPKYPYAYQLQIFVYNSGGLAGLIAKVFNSILGDKSTVYFDQTDEGFNSILGTVSRKFIPNVYLPTRRGNLASSFRRRRSQIKPTPEAVNEKVENNAYNIEKDSHLAALFRPGYVSENPLDVWGLKSDSTIAVTPRISYFLGAFLEIRLFTDVSSKDVNLVRNLRARIESEIGAEALHQLPIEFAGYVNLIRILRRSKGNLQKALNHFINMMEFRKLHDIDRKLETIKSGNLRINEIPGFLKYQRALPVILEPVRDKNNGSVLFLASVLRKMNLKICSEYFPEDDFFEFSAYLFMYFSILADELSRKEKRVVSIIHVLDVEGVMIKQIPNILVAAVKIPSKNTKLDEIMTFRADEDLYWGCPRRMATFLENVIVDQVPTVSNKAKFLPSSETGQERFHELYGIEASELFHRDANTYIYSDLKSLVNKLSLCKTEEYELPMTSYQKKNRDSLNL